MNKQFYALRLIPCRPDFAFTMTDDERAIMQQHIVYWQDFMSRGHVITFGPVMDPAGPYGLGIVGFDSEEAVKEFMKNDPATSINSYEYHPMMAVVAAP